MAAKMVNAPPHGGQVVRSIAKTRLSNCAQLMPAREETEARSPVRIGDVRHLGALVGHDLRPQRGIRRQHAKYESTGLDN